MTALFAHLGSSPVLRWALGVLAALALAVTAVWWLRQDAARDARNQVAVEAAKNQERVRREADAAARAAERDDVRERLRNGTFLLDPVPARD